MYLFHQLIEFLGDRVLDFYVVKVIADRFGFVKSQSDYYDEENDLDEYCIVAHKNEADFTELKKQIVSNETLAKTIDKLGLFKYMYLGDLAEKGRCSIPEYYQSEEQLLMSDGRLMLECTCYIRSWAMKHTAYATSKKEAKRYAAYLVLCDFF